MLVLRRQCVRGPRDRRGTCNCVCCSERLGFSVVLSNEQALGRWAIARDVADAVKVQSTAGGGCSRGVSAVERCVEPWDVQGPRRDRQARQIALLVLAKRTMSVYPDTTMAEIE